MARACRPGASRRRCCASRAWRSPSARASGATTSSSSVGSIAGAESRIDFFDMPRVDVLVVDPPPGGRGAVDPLPGARRRRRADRRPGGSTLQAHDEHGGPVRYAHVSLCMRPPRPTSGARPRAPRRARRRLRVGQEGDRPRRDRPARRRRLHGLLRDLLGRHRPPGQGDPRRHPRGAEEGARAAAAARRGRSPSRAGSSWTTSTSSSTSSRPTRATSTASSSSGATCRGSTSRATSLRRPRCSRFERPEDRGGRAPGRAEVGPLEQARCCRRWCFGLPRLLAGLVTMESIHPKAPHLHLPPARCSSGRAGGKGSALPGQRRAGVLADVARPTLKRRRPPGVRRPSVEWS